MATIEYDDLPTTAIDRVERRFVDTIGVALAGARTYAGAIAVETTSTLSGGCGPATLVGTEISGSLTDAAFANGTAGHCLDFDDVSGRLHVHPSVVLLPPILALSEQQKVSGPEAITSYIAGYEVMNFLAEPVKDVHYERGWHSTATIGTYGATVAAATLLGLEKFEVKQALNIASSTAAGIKRNFGSMTKPMHAGQAARSGLTAALLAADGFTAAADTLSGEGGFYDLYTDDGGPNRDEHPTLGSEWAIVKYGIDTKKFPCCYFTHSAIAAAAQLADDHDLRPVDIDRIEVIGSGAAGDALVHKDPSTGLEAKFSMQYTVASSIARDTVDLDAFDDDELDDPETQMIRERVEFDVDPELTYGSHEVTINIHLTNGKAVTKRRIEPPGTIDHPLSDDEIEKKYRMCASRVFPEEEIDWTYNRLSDLRSQNDLGAIVDRLGGQ